MLKELDHAQFTRTHHNFDTDSTTIRRALKGQSALSLASQSKWADSLDVREFQFSDAQFPGLKRAILQRQ